MPQPTKGPRLGGSPAHQRLILANLATSLFEHGGSPPPRPRPSGCGPYAERLITKAKRGDLHNRRADRQGDPRQGRRAQALRTRSARSSPTATGGYTRITKTLPRKGDNAPMAVIELVAQKTVTYEADRARRVAGVAAGGAGSAARAAATSRGRLAVVDETPDGRTVRRRGRGVDLHRRGAVRRGQPRPAGRPGRGPGGLRDQGQRRLDALPRPRDAVLRPHGGRGVVRHGRGRRGRRVLASAVAARRPDDAATQS